MSDRGVDRFAVTPGEGLVQPASDNETANSDATTNRRLIEPPPPVA